jgi:hypothetical protein
MTIYIYCKLSYLYYLHMAYLKEISSVQIIIQLDLVPIIFVSLIFLVHFPHVHIRRILK